MNYLLYIIAILSLSQAGVIAKWGAAPPEMMGFWRLLLASMVMLPIAIKYGDFNNLISKRSKDFRWVLVSAIFFFLHLWTYIYAAQNAPIANSMIIFSINPLFISLGAYLFFKEIMTFKLLLSFVFALSGVYLLIEPKLQSLAHFNGELSAFASAIFFAFYILASKKARTLITNSSFATVKYFLTACLFLLLALFNQTSLTAAPSPNTWMAIALVIIFPTLLGHALISYLMKHLDVNWMSCGKLAEPAFSTLVAYFLFSESISNQTLTAFTLTGAALLILFVPNIIKQMQIAKR